MMIDTMVVAYALLRVEDQHEQAIVALEAAEQIIVPDSLFAELGNVVWQWTTSPTKLCQSGDILFCVRGATAGRLNVADKQYCLG